MPMTNAGRNFMAGAIVGAEATLFNNANSRIGVGDSTTAFAATQTDLQAATNRIRKGMVATFPTRSTNTLVFRSEFTGAEANFAWNEYGIFNAASGGVMLNRRVQSNGTKIAGQIWIFEVTVTTAIGV